MIKIYSNYNKEDVTYSFTAGQNFPEVNGKLLRVEINGSELEKLVETKEIPLYESMNGKPVKHLYLVWNGKEAGRILKTLREIFSI